MPKDREMFNSFEAHEVNYMASKFQEPKAEVVAKIKELKKEKKIHYSTHKEVEALLIEAGFTKK